MARTPAPSTRKPGGNTAPGTTPPRVGEDIQRLRLERQMTLDDLSRAAGVSKSMLSEIERNRANPTIAVVWRLANALGIRLDDLFAQDRPEEGLRIVGQHEIPMLASERKGYQLRVWGPVELAGSFEWYELTLQPGGALVSEAHEPGTQEHLTVFQGAIEVQSGSHGGVVQAGQTARYPADVEHALRNTGAEPSRALLVVVQA